MSLVTYSPFRMMARDPFLRDFFRNELHNGADLQEARVMVVPRMNLEEKDSAYNLTVEVPGLSKEDIHIEIDAGRLAIWGEKRAEKTEEKGKKFHLREISYGSFRREILLPDDVKAEAIEARYDNGHLAVTLPKVERKLPRKIEVTL